MKSLKSRLIDRIKADGPITIAEYMTICLTDPKQGYYVSRDPFGTSGDFITAPEISQMFGEILGAWATHIWQLLDEPDSWHLVECGPGRGTCMSDMLRAIKTQTYAFRNLSVNLIEISPALRSIQADILKKSGKKPHWHNDLTTLPKGPTVFIANEFFDALPIRQYIKSDKAWHERVVGVQNENLTFGLGPAILSDIIPEAFHASPKGSVVEISPQREAICRLMAEHIKEQSGAALIIDYGYLKPSTGDTLQAVGKHKYTHILNNPGEDDLTSHVDMYALANAAQSAGAIPAPMITQGEFLVRLGLLERASILGRDGTATSQFDIKHAVNRLAGNAPGKHGGMGDLFKVLCFYHGIEEPEPFTGEAPRGKPRGFYVPIKNETITN
jgi:SAM-dependent MidA family methyltransferase